MDAESGVKHQMSNSPASAALTSGAGWLVYDTDCFSTVLGKAALGATQLIAGDLVKIRLRRYPAIGKRFGYRSTGREGSLADTRARKSQ